MRFYTFECHFGLKDGVQLAKVGDSLSLTFGELIGREILPSIPMSTSNPPTVSEEGRVLRGSIGVDHSTGFPMLKEEEEADRFQAGVLVFSSPTREVLEASSDRHGVVKRFRTSEVWRQKGFCPVLNLDGTLVDKYVVELLILSPEDCAIIRPYGVNPRFSKGHKTIACFLSEGEITIKVGPFKDYTRYRCQQGEARILSFHMRSGNNPEVEVSSL